MSARTNHFKIGMFVLAALVLLVAALLAFGARAWFEERATFETCVVGDVEGLSVGSPVKLRGVPVGSVSLIDFTGNVYPESTNSFVVIEFEVSKRINNCSLSADQKGPVEASVRRGLRARVKGQGITGTSIVSLEFLDPADNPPPEIDFTPRHYYIPSAPSQFSQLLASIEKSLRQLEELDFGEISDRLTSVLHSVDSVLTKLEAVEFRRIGADVLRLTDELRATNTKLHDLVSSVASTVDEMKLEAVARNADELLSELRTTNAKLQTTLDQIAATPLEEAARGVRQAAKSLDEAIGTLKEYPSGFFFGKPPPPARSVKSK